MGQHSSLALKVVSSRSSTYYLQILGEPGSFVFAESVGNDHVTATHRIDIKIWDLDNRSDVERVRDVAKTVCIDTDTVLWNCQDWCMDVIQELKYDLVIGVEDDGDGEDLLEWMRLKRRLVREMGPEI